MFHNTFRFFIFLVVVGALGTPESRALSLEVGHQFRKVIKTFLPKGFDVTWTQAKINFNLKGASFSGKNFCLIKKTTEDEICFERASLELAISKLKLVPSKSSIVLEQGRVHWTADNQQNATKKSLDLYEEIQSALQVVKKYQFKKISISVEKIKLKPKGSSFLIENLTLSNRSLDEGYGIELKASSISYPAQKILSRKNIFQITYLEESVSAQMNAKLKFQEQEEVDVAIKLNPHELKMNAPLTLSANVEAPILRARAPVKLPCELVLSARKPSRLNCRISESLSRLISNRGNKKENKQNVAADFKCIDRNCSLEISIEKIVKAHFKIKSVLERSEGEGQLSIEVTDFGKMSQILEERGWGLPVPLSQLKGQVSLSSNFRHEEYKRWRVPLDLKTSLTSETQKLVISVSVSSKLNDKEMKITSDILIKELSLHLPEFAVERFPQLNRDQRIVENRGGPDLFKYDFGIKTETAGAIKIYSKRLKEPLSLSCQLKVSSSNPLLGWVAIEKTDVEFLKRKAAVDSIKLKLLAPVEDSSIQGLIKMHQAGYDIKILLSGTLKEPIVRFESSPILSESEIASLIIYGHRTSELDGAESVASVKTRVITRSMGLFSSYIFAATPIDSVIYNPDDRSLTGYLSMGRNRISVREQDSSVKSVGIERRLFGNFFLNSRREISEESSTTTTIEWEKRY